MLSISFLAFLTSYTFFLPLASATPVQDDDVSWAVVVLSDIPATLATPFCEGFVASYAPTADAGNIGGGATVTVTTTVGPESCGTVVPSVTTTPTSTPSTPAVITAYSTTTITYMTTSTIFVAPTAPPSAGGYGRRGTWCPNEGVPCRLAQYDYPTIYEACGLFLGNSGAVTVTVTATATTCGGAAVTEPTGGYGDGGDYGYGYGDDGYGDDIVPAFGDGWYGQAPYNSDENSGDYGDY